MPYEAPPSQRRSYVVHGVIAAGGMATVHVGRLVGPGGFARTVAIKRLHPQFLADAEVAESFAEEARLSARIAHANVAAVLDVVVDGGEPLLVMEYVHGESLSRLLMTSRGTKQKVPVPILASIVCDMLHGLHAAHEATREDGTRLQLVHRDVSPQNVIVGVDGVARVVDFGIAKAIGRAQVTREGQLKGKMPYMAPEQLLRRSVDRRTDVYAAGVILWEGLAGKRLFLADDEPTLFSKVLEDVIPSPRSLDAEVPPALDAVAMRALSRDPDQRYATARDMAIAIEEATALAPSSAVADWVARTAREALAERAAKIGEMERESAAQADGTPNSGPSASVVFRSADSRRGKPTEPGATAATPHAETGSWVTPTGRSRTSRIGIGIGVALLSILALVVFFGWRRGPESAGAAAATSAPLVAPAAAAVDPIGAPATLGVASPPSTGTASPVSAVGAGNGETLASALPAGAPSAAPRAKPHAAPAAQWCKVFDPNKRVYVMKSMRVSRCP